MIQSERDYVRTCLNARHTSVADQSCCLKDPCLCADPFRGYTVVTSGRPPGPYPLEHLPPDPHIRRQRRNDTQTTGGN